MQEISIKNIIKLVLSISKKITKLCKTFSYNYFACALKLGKRQHVNIEEHDI